MNLKSLSIFLAIICASRRVIIVPVVEYKDQIHTCKSYGLSDAYVRNDALSQYVDVLNKFGLESALTNDWEGSPFSGVLRTNKTLTPYDPASNTSKHKICARGRLGKFVEPNFRLTPEIWTTDKIKKSIFDDSDKDSSTKN
ncbi:hypothetical protein EDEG_03633 [Edhazardia aedis USNM 41457]|uniref:Uncharacterized protein n=1 Tax=Edhazardia aedis (strain USNM 41457) TaxID=1003232 RepID=J9DH10_EDHAE|nr:hypothetical protein EDEG_03633 [Edhazardia aedis USNM 41457]|eukprot:EJW01890.1 hypothetical protein EDEG_03633 [Edhazardia aedis USNM 41457]